MISFISRNLDSIIISTVFLFLESLPMFFEPNKSKNKPNGQNISIENSKVENNNINNIYSKNIYNNKTYIENKNNQSTVIIDQTSSTSNDDSLDFFVFCILLIGLFVFFYKYINKILSYSIGISLSNIFLSILLYNKFKKENDYILIPKIIFSISMRNLLFWILILINNFIIFYKRNFSPAVKTFILSIKGSISQNIFFIFKHPHESFFVIFNVFSLIVSILVMFKLICSYIWLISYIKLIKNENKFWWKINHSLYKKESTFKIENWIWLTLILLLLDIGIFFSLR